MNRKSDFSYSIKNKVTQKICIIIQNNCKLLTKKKANDIMIMSKIIQNRKKITIIDKRKILKERKHEKNKNNKIYFNRINFNNTRI